MARRIGRKLTEDADPRKLGKWYCLHWKQRPRLGTLRFFLHLPLPELPKLLDCTGSVPVRQILIAAAKITSDKEIANRNPLIALCLIYPSLAGLLLPHKNASPGSGMKASHSWIVLWRPGTRYGACWSVVCSHPNCNRIRCLASQICPLCKESVGYQSRLAEFHCEDFPSVKLCHLSCIEAYEVGDDKARDKPKAKAAT
jgi:hypothetical protein